MYMYMYMCMYVFVYICCLHEIGGFVISPHRFPVCYYVDTIILPVHPTNALMYRHMLLLTLYNSIWGTQPSHYFSSNNNTAHRQQLMCVVVMLWCVPIPPRLSCCCCCRPVVVAVAERLLLYLLCVYFGGVRRDVCFVISVRTGWYM
eukprot:GHVS01107259.1.p1 GENE.GHVS01107259.1~~GHVS01107259.1.p1  ORF type:complete len:147 (+),score=21.37 GHVS01107259.1:3-443(+)